MYNAYMFSVWNKEIYLLEGGRNIRIYIYNVYICIMYICLVYLLVWNKEIYLLEGGRNIRIYVYNIIDISAIVSAITSATYGYSHSLKVYFRNRMHCQTILIF